ncbi:Plasmodium exported protein (PHISTa), unknown, putative [Plasmodium sp.]|nr:Plasmodium exported protein (PHISTa), unknown, putative [Plasmodium sp.]
MNSLESNRLEIHKNCNVYKRNLGEAEKNNKRSKGKRNLKQKKEDVNKTKSSEKNIKCNKQKIEENKYSSNNDRKNTNVENKSNSSMSNINYNDLSKNLTETELLDVLNSLKECPPKEDLRNIWNHTISVAKEGFDDILKELKGLIQKYLDNDVHVTDVYGHGGSYIYENIWKEYCSVFCKTVANEEIEYTNGFYRLINVEHTLDDILKFIYSFLEHIEILKKELHEKHQKELLEKISKTLKK